MQSSSVPRISPDLSRQQQASRHPSSSTRGFKKELVRVAATSQRKGPKAMQPVLIDALSRLSCTEEGRLGTLCSQWTRDDSPSTWQADVAALVSSFVPLLHSASLSVPSVVTIETANPWPLLHFAGELVQVFRVQRYKGVGGQTRIDALLQPRLDKRHRVEVHLRYGATGVFAEFRSRSLNPSELEQLKELWLQQMLGV